MGQDGGVPIQLVWIFSFVRLLHSLSVMGLGPTNVTLFSNISNTHPSLRVRVLFFQHGIQPGFFPSSPPLAIAVCQLPEPPWLALHLPPVPLLSSIVPSSPLGLHSRRPSSPSTTAATVGPTPWQVSCPSSPLSSVGPRPITQQRLHLPPSARPPLLLWVAAPRLCWSLLRWPPRALTHQQGPGPSGHWPYPRRRFIHPQAATGSASASLALAWEHERITADTLAGQLAKAERHLLGAPCLKPLPDPPAVAPPQAYKAAVIASLYAQASDVQNIRSLVPIILDLASS